MSAPDERRDVAVPESEVERRQFLGRIGKYAAVTPPAITMMLTASAVPAYARGSNAGLGNGSEGGDPGNSGAHNQAANAPANPHSPAAQADPSHEFDDPDEPN
jgi:hypothetical protein